MADSVYQVDRSLDITDEVAEKLKGRREKMARRQTRHQQQVEVGDFSGLDTPPQKKDGGSAPLTEVDADEFEVEGDKTLVADDGNIKEVEAEAQDTPINSSISKLKGETTAKLSSTHGVTLGDISQEEETPVPTKRKRSRRGEYQQSVGKEVNFTEIETPENSVVEPAVMESVDPDEEAVAETGTAPTRKDRSRRGKDVDVEDFGGISLASAQPTGGQSEEETAARKVPRSRNGMDVDAEETRTEAVQTASAQPTPAQSLSSTNFTMGLTINEEETPVRKTRAQKMVVDVGDFTDISIAEQVDEQDNEEEEYPAVEATVAA